MGVCFYTFLMIDHQIDLILDSFHLACIGLTVPPRVDGSVICAKPNVAQKGEVVGETTDGGESRREDIQRRLNLCLQTIFSMRTHSPIFRF